MAYNLKTKTRGKVMTVKDEVRTEPLHNNDHNVAKFNVQKRHL
jgi:hypothetical protein